MPPRAIVGWQHSGHPSHVSPLFSYKYRGDEETRVEKKKKSAEQKEKRERAEERRKRRKKEKKTERGREKK